MSLLADRTWKHKYSRDDGDLVADFYVPALECAVRYDRSTGYFTAGALALAARGIRGLLANDGRMRLLVGCTLDQPEVDAIAKGESLKAVIDARTDALALPPPDTDAPDGLGLLAALIARGKLQVRVAVPCDSKRRPVPADGIFHSKTGVIEDKTGDKLAFSGSLNETSAGWQTNFENFHVFASWKGGEGHVQAEEEEFQRLWDDESPHAVVLDVPAALAQKLLAFLPKTDKPAPKPPSPPQPLPPVHIIRDPNGTPPPVPDPFKTLRDQAWAFINQAAQLPNGGERVGEATSVVEPWPHQIRAFQRMYSSWPPKLLIADEVGLGKTIEAGLLLRQAWLAGRAKRILILTPKAVIRQWQIELREKFNLNWPIYDGNQLEWAKTPLAEDAEQVEVSRSEWHREPCVLVSSHLVRRTDRAAELLAAEPWDLVIVDEAHHARRRGGGTADDSPNGLLRLLRELKTRTSGLILLTATPMQVSPVEVWDLMSLLGLPAAWSASTFLRYFEQAANPNLTPDDLDFLARLFQATEATFGETDVRRVQALGGGISALRAKTILRALRSSPNMPRRMLSAPDRQLALSLLRQETPVRRLISRHTRELLRRYRDEGKLTSRIANRHVEDEFVDLSPAEKKLYDDVENYISSTWDQASSKERNAVGFVMTIYRRRLASSFAALSKTLEGRSGNVSASTSSHLALEDLPDEDESTEPIEQEDAVKLEHEALKLEERGVIDQLLAAVRQLPTDTKAVKLRSVLARLSNDGYEQVMVFTQYTDTMDFLRTELAANGVRGLMCFSGRGGEVRRHDGTWQLVSREDIKRRFKNKEAEVLLCTDAAAEGLNFQFCGALVNYDMPWNPMRVEQRIGRIDRLGQAFDDIRIVNLHYADTVEADVYIALRQRIGLFSQFIGKLQPILARLPGEIREVTLRSANERRQSRADLVDGLSKDVDKQQASGFDLDEMVAADFEVGSRPQPPLTLDLLDRLLRLRILLPPGMDASPLGPREYSATVPSQIGRVRLTTDPKFFDEHPESTELWSPGSTTFPNPLIDFTGNADDNLDSVLARAEELLERQIADVQTRAGP